MVNLKERIRQEDMLNQFIDEYSYPSEVNIFPKSCDAQDALTFLQELILGKDWYISAPLSREQINSVIAVKIAERFINK
jgi:hypothetical protein